MTAKDNQKIEKVPTKEAERKARDVSIAGFSVAIASVFINIFTLGLAAVVGLIISIVGRVQSSKLGNPNPFALAGIIISGSVMFITFMMLSLLIAFIAVVASYEDYNAPTSSETVCVEGRRYMSSHECGSPVYDHPRTRS